MFFRFASRKRAGGKSDHLEGCTPHPAPPSSSLISLELPIAPKAEKQQPQIQFGMRLVIIDSMKGITRSNDKRSEFCVLWCQAPAVCFRTGFLAVKISPGRWRRLNLEASKFNPLLFYLNKWPWSNCYYFLTSLYNLVGPQRPCGSWGLLPCSQVHLSVSRWKNRASDTHASRRYGERRCQRDI